MLEIGKKVKTNRFEKNFSRPYFKAISRHLIKEVKRRDWKGKMKSVSKGKRIKIEQTEKPTWMRNFTTKKKWCFSLFRFPLIPSHALYFSTKKI